MNACELVMIFPNQCSAADAADKKMDKKLKPDQNLVSLVFQCS